MIKAKYLSKLEKFKIYLNCCLNAAVSWWTAFSNASSRVSNLNSRYNATTAGKQ